MSILMSIFLGIVQGLTEFLPVSSSGHLSIIQNLFGMDYAEEEHLLFDVMLHAGTLIAVCIFYRNDLKSMCKDTFALLAGHKSGKNEDGRLTPSVRMVLMIIIATLPLFVIVPINGRIESLYYNTPFVSFALIITGLLLYVAGRLSEGRKSGKTSTVADALIIGAAQAIATIPGLSRSGTTITVALARGYKRDYAVKFSFLMSIPAVLGSLILTLFDAVRTGIEWANVPVYLVGMVTAGVVGYFALYLLKRIVAGDSFGKFAYYCWGVGILSLLLSIIL